MKSIATINFKGGAGKTTVTWLLAKYLVEKLGKKTLIVDIDAQMCLTLAVQLDENKGKLNKDFDIWSHQNDNQRSLTKVIETFEKTKGDPLNFSFNSLIFKMSDKLHLIPSTIDMYWFEYDTTDREKIKNFVNLFLKKLEKNSDYNYDYVLFDCPPYFNALSYSVLSCASMVLIPVNPDILAYKAIYLFIEGLTKRLKPMPVPKISVFMNKAKIMREHHLTTESNNYLNEVKKVKTNLEHIGTKIEVFDSFIPERVDMKPSLPKASFPADYEEYVQKLWNNIEKKL